MNLREIKSALAKHRRFKNRCYVCRKPFGKGFAFHHVYYIQNDVKYSDFKTSLAYHVALEPLIKSNPSRFLLLCKAHHHLVEWGNSLNEPAFKRFVLAVGQTRRARRWNPPAQYVVVILNRWQSTMSCAVCVTENFIWWGSGRSESFSCMWVFRCGKRGL